jgi:uncharacterized protein
MSKEALLIFVKKPEPGKVKTRLAKSIGDEKAIMIYHHLLGRTLEITRGLLQDKFVFYHPEIVYNDLWAEEGYYKRQQASGNLGEKMKAGFHSLFQQGYGRVCVIGSDCYTLTTGILEDAFNSLNEHDVCIGPSEDGGYYLLGMKRLHSDFFTNKTWSTNSVFTATMADAARLNLSVCRLPILNDVDNIDDLGELINLL